MGTKAVRSATHLVASSFVLVAGTSILSADEFRTPAISVARVEWRAALDQLRSEINATAVGKLGGALIRPAARRLRTRLDPDTYGGAYLLGLRSLAVVAHGDSSSRAVANAIRLAARGVAGGVVRHVAERLRQPETAGAAR